MRRQIAFLTLSAAVFLGTSLHADILCAKVKLAKKTLKPKILTQVASTETCPKGFQLLLDSNLVSTLGIQGPPGADGTVVGVPAGGVLTGTYPSPGLADAAVGPNNLDVFPGVALRKTGTQTIPSNNSTDVTFNIESYDDMDFFPGTGSDITIPLSGKYTISGFVNFLSNSTGIRQLTLVKNVTDTLAISSIPAAAAAGVTIEISTTNQFNAGDTLKLRAVQNSGGDLNTGSIGSTHAGLSVQWVGP